MRTATHRTEGQGLRRAERAYALGFGATGLTFNDDDVTEFFSPHAAGKSVMFLVALGYADRAALGLVR